MAQTAVGGAKSFADSLSYEKSAIEGATKLVADASVAAMDIAQAALEKGRDGGESYATGVARCEWKERNIWKKSCASGN